ncbi:aldo/keto reductase [Pochonia chlamydosporia 170]|uniref:Aldo/keto reductase n=1 Tax=Pochonia chlamydosporia 170 TaxID=1380566 RepID=A0A179EZG3_METCM|nr:aldo/keto reductase [Pochonia chlamydosporia 170]OAQ58576.2 aldo/keto reductase [Pochonia chlamydosporia 170]
MANQTSRTFTLNTGAKIPAVGLGTWQSKPNEVQSAVEAALRHGYRHIDTAAAYKNEKEVGAGIKASGVPRSDIWLTTKLDNPDQTRAAEALDQSLKNLGTDYVDLYLMHWPAATDPNDGMKLVPDWSFIDTWRDMQKLVGTGKVRNIGVSNFAIKNLEKLLSDESCKSNFTPATHRPSSSPTTPPKASTAPATHASDQPTPLSTPTPLLELAKAKGKTPQQVLLMWGLQKGWSVIPKSVTASRIEANYALDGWSLTDEEVKSLDGIKDRFKVCGDDWLPVKVFFGDDE